MPNSQLESIRNLLENQRAEIALVKLLSPNQDNEKNQIYLGTSDSLLSQFPGELSFLGGSQSGAKSHSDLGRGKEVLSLNFSWLGIDGVRSPAPQTKLIYYFQYPEIRMSGFLTGSPEAPRALRRRFQDEYQWRVLILGISGNEVFGMVITDRNGEGLLDEFRGLPRFPGQELLLQLPLTSQSSATNLHSLSNELADIAGIWHPGVRLGGNPPALTPYQGPQGSGWTLEALLSIPMNSRSEPDKFGYEMKVLAHTGALSLITSEPDFGLRKELGLSDFLHRYGWPGKKDDGSFRFNGEHNTLRPYPASGAQVEIDHWDAAINGPDGTGEPTVMVIHEDTGAVLAGWTLESLAAKWSKKHAGCIYVEYDRYPEREGLASHYRYGPRAYCGLGTSVNNLLRALSSGLVFLDPGDRVSKDGEEKHRMQWRTKSIRGQRLPDRLPALYNDWQVIELCDESDLAKAPIEFDVSREP